MYARCYYKNKKKVIIYISLSLIRLITIIAFVDDKTKVRYYF